ncbi:MAG: ClpXP protease specificity-enhancing factor [Gammaproteobacteria bacterium]
MLSNKPYLIRAFYEWIVDSKCTPFLVVDANHPRCKIPQHFVEDGQITLNIAPEAVRDLKISNELVEFQASFTGIVHIISAPIRAVLAVYAQENGQGMFFDFEEGDGDIAEWDNAIIEQPTQPPVIQGDSKKRPSHLKLVD